MSSNKCDVCGGVFTRKRFGIILYGKNIHVDCELPECSRCGMEIGEGGTESLCRDCQEDRANLEASAVEVLKGVNSPIDMVEYLIGRPWSGALRDLDDDEVARINFDREPVELHRANRNK